MEYKYLINGISDIFIKANLLKDTNSISNITNKNNIEYANILKNEIMSNYENILMLKSSLADYNKKLDFKNNTLNTISNKTIKLNNVKNVLSTLRRDKKNLIKAKDKIAVLIKNNTDKKYIITLLKSNKLKSLYRYCRMNNILPIKHSTDLIKNYSKITYNNLISVPVNTIYSGEYSGYTTNKVKCITKLPRDKANLTVKKIKELNGSVSTFDTTCNSFINTSILRYSTHKAITSHGNLPSNIITMQPLSNEELLNKQVNKILGGNKLNYDFISKFSLNEISNKFTEVSNEINIINNFTNAINGATKVDCNSTLNKLLQGLA